jgi:tetratricopeptide (TPR) repeat protein
VLEVEPNCLKTLYRISRALMAQKNYDEAEKYLKRGFAIDPMEQEILKALEEVETARNPPPKN